LKRGRAISEGARTLPEIFFVIVDRFVRSISLYSVITFSVGNS
jgi:hypothetical protein